jgi:hypothetical protein
MRGAEDEPRAKAKSSETPYVVCYKVRTAVPTHRDPYRCGMNLQARRLSPALFWG